MFYIKQDQPKKPATTKFRAIADEKDDTSHSDFPKQQCTEKLLTDPLYSLVTHSTSTRAYMCINAHASKGN